MESINWTFIHYLGRSVVVLVLGSAAHREHILELELEKVLLRKKRPLSSENT